MAFSGGRYATWVLLCGGVFLTGTRLGAAQEEIAPPSSESPFRDDAVQDQPRRNLGDEPTRGIVNCPTPAELEEWFKPLDRIRMSARPVDGRMPIDCSTQLFYSPTDRRAATGTGRNWAPSEFDWVAPNLAAQPTYWDDVPLERYGQTISPAAQPGISGAKFFLNFAIIPYKIGIDRTHDLIYTLGYYRPGSPTPPVRQRLPWEWDAAAFEALSVTGMIFILP